MASVTPTEAPEAEVTEVPEVDPVTTPEYAAFVQAVEEVVTTPTGEDNSVSANDLGTVNEAFKVLESGKPRAAARKYVSDAMEKAMEDPSTYDVARRYLTVRKGLTAAGSGVKAEPKAPADPTEAFVANVSAVYLGYGLLTKEAPQGVSADWQDKVQKLTNDLAGDMEKFVAWNDSTDPEKGEAPEVSAVVRAAYKIATGRHGGVARKGAPRGGGVVGGPRRNIAEHIREYFSTKAVGEWASIADIRGFSSKEYGTEVPSAGAISSRLFPQGDAEKCTLDPAQVLCQSALNADGKKGAVRI